jgi:NCAIR mutase (PurE)-related protein
LSLANGGQPASALYCHHHREGHDDQQKLRVALGVARHDEIESAVDELRLLPYEDVGFAKIDHHRALRDALPEVVLALGKTPEQTAEIARRLVERAGRVLITRADRPTFEAVVAAIKDATYHEAGRAITVDRRRADLPVAEEPPSPPDDGQTVPTTVALRPHRPPITRPRFVTRAIVAVAGMGGAHVVAACAVPRRRTDVGRLRR